MQRLKSLTTVVGRDVAVLGCSFGYECQLMINEGANSVVGFDMDPRVGSNHSDRRITYHQRSIVSTGEPTGAFDIVYSAAVLEHVHDLAGAMSEAVRICKPGGIVFLLSSPLWYSPYGNHMIAFLEQLPWCHLLYGPSALRRKILEVRPEFADRSVEVDGMVDRIHDPVYFNRLPPVAYANAVDQLRGARIVSNNFWPASVAPSFRDVYLPLCVDRGYVEKDLMIGAHYLVLQPQPG